MILFLHVRFIIKRNNNKKCFFLTFSVDFYAYVISVMLQFISLVIWYGGVIFRMLRIDKRDLCCVQAYVCACVCCVIQLMNECVCCVCVQFTYESVCCGVSSLRMRVCVVFISACKCVSACLPLQADERKLQKQLRREVSWRKTTIPL